MRAYKVMSRKIYAAILGAGTVGTGVYKLCQSMKDDVISKTGAELVVKKVLVRNLDKDRDPIDRELLTDNWKDIIEDKDIEIVIELMGGTTLARERILEALEAGKNVVTANKDLIAEHGEEIFEKAQEKGLDVQFEAAVAGAIPIIRPIMQNMDGDNITEVMGIVNGTTNYILTKMSEEGLSYEKALAEATELGYAEADPTADVEGIDAAYKAVILSQFGFGATIDFDDVTHKGITNISTDDVAVAQELGYVIKLVGDVREVESGISAEVSPTFLPKNHPLASVNDVMNAVFVESIGIGESMYYGPGAGQKPTATSVLADIIRIARRLSDGNVGKPFNEFRRDLPLANPADVKSNYYFALDTPDEKGKILHLSEIFNSEDISFEQVLQQKANGTTARIVVITHAMSKTQLKAVTEKLEAAEDFTVVNTLKVLSN